MLPDDPIDNDDPSDRSALVAALVAEGLPAYVYHSGGGLYHVCVDILNANTYDLVQIATGSVDTPCDVGIMGWGLTGNIQSGTWVRARTLAEATHAFLSYWRDREVWVKRFYEGNLNV